MTTYLNFKSIISCLFLFFVITSKINCQITAVSNFILNFNISYDDKTNDHNNLNGYWLIFNEHLVLETIEFYEKDALTSSFHSSNKYNEMIIDKKVNLDNNIKSEITLVNQLYKKDIKYKWRKKIIADNLKLLLMDLKLAIEEEKDINRLEQQVDKIEKIHHRSILFKKIKTKSLIKKLRKINDFEEMKNLMLL